MSTTIEWTQRPGTRGETWNPVVGCTKVSAGCKFCYAKRIHDARHKAFKAGKLQKTPQYAQPFEKVQLMHDRLDAPLHWKQPRTVFVNSVSDLFHEDVPFEFIDQVFAIMALTPRHTYQILTKRPERMAEYMNRPLAKTDPQITHSDLLAVTIIDLLHDRPEFEKLVTVPDWFFEVWPLANVWLGTSVENQATANERIPHLLRCPAAIRFLSCEPLLGPMDLRSWLHIATDRDGLQRGFSDLHWVITGGESGPGARPMHPDWARSLRDQCAAAGVPFFFKQWGEYKPTCAQYPKTEAEILECEEASRCGDIALEPDGVIAEGYQPISNRTWLMDKVGKSNSGHLLDGIAHLAFPTMSTPSTELATP